MATIPAFLTQLEPRERHVLIGGAMVLTLLLGYFLLWEPFITARQQLETIVAAREQDLQWMQQAALEIQQLRQQPTMRSPATRTTSLLTLIDSSTRTGDLATVNKRIEPQGDAVRVNFSQVRFMHLMQWLALLQAQHGVQVQTVTLERAEGLDQVQAHLLLVYGAA